MVSTRSSRVCPVATARPARTASAAARRRRRARASVPGPGTTSPSELAMRHGEPGGERATGLRIGGALGPAELVLHVQRLERMAELVQRVSEQRRVGAAGDEDEHGLPASEQPSARDRRADTPDQRAVERHDAAIRPA